LARQAAPDQHSEIDAIGKSFSASPRLKRRSGKAA
jgi:hypothetical protein